MDQGSPLQSSENITKEFICSTPAHRHTQMNKNLRKSDKNLEEGPEIHRLAPALTLGYHGALTQPDGEDYRNGRQSYEHD
jgi:hypothetical protein